MKKRVLITGGFGYLGGRIAVELARSADWEVYLGSRSDRKEKPRWLVDAGISSFDILRPETLEAALKDVDAVIHLAAMNENRCVENPAQAVVVNTIGTLNVLNAALSAGIERFIYFSTAHVYGSPLVGYIDEKNIPRPTHPYAITHKAAEDFVLASHDQGKITGIVVRLSNGFGTPTHPNVDRWTLLANDLCRQAIQHQNLTLRSSGLQQRDFITLANVGRAVKHLINLPIELCEDGLFNVGGGTSMSVWQMAQLIASRCKEVLGFTPGISRPQPKASEESLKIQYDMSKIKNTGFFLTGTIEEELDNMLIFCRDSFGVK